MKRMMLMAALASTSVPATAQNAQPTDPPSSHHVSAAAPAEARHVVRFWIDAGPSLWFAKISQFDTLFRAHFREEHDAAARGELEEWIATPDGALALMILLDQYPRNSFRGTPRMYATDEAARRYADLAIARGHDRAVPEELQMFFYLPFGHSESLADQNRSVELCRRLGEYAQSRAEHHRDIVRRFGRFPHRNAILGRAMAPDEQAYLEHGGYSG